MCCGQMIMRHSLDVISTHESVSGSCSFLSVSPSVARLTGYSPEELMGRPLFDFVSRECAAALYIYVHIHICTMHY
jgi:PAS domain S-box-containing protein